MASKTPQHLQHPDRAARATFAKHTINTVIPHILHHNPRARAGNESTERIYYSPETANDRTRHKKAVRSDHQDKKKSNLGKITGHFKPLHPRKETGPSSQTTTSSTATVPDVVATSRGQANGAPNDDEQDGVAGSAPSTTPKPKVTVMQSDTLDAAHLFVDNKVKDRSIAVLNMASFLRPGGGVINGAIAQEESLCLRSTLYTALDEKFYRLPKFGGLFTKDILVFRDSDNKDLPRADWYYVDVISVAALKRPDLIKADDGKEVYEFEQDKEEMISKIKLILRTALKNNTTHLILGALGCGAYHNPPEEVAKMFRRVIFGNSKGQWAMNLSGIEEICFAIFDDGINLKVFKDTFENAQATSTTAGNGPSRSEDLPKDGNPPDVTMGNA